MKTIKYAYQINPAYGEWVKNYARQKYGRDRGEVEKEIAERAKIKDQPFSGKLPPLPPPRETSR
jgi:hypothetical protein